MVHEQAYFRLRVASVSLEVAAALAFAGLLFLVTRGANSVRNSVVALLLGIVLYVCLMFLGISLMDYNVPRQRSYAVDFMILEIGCLGCLLASEALGLSSKRIPGVVTGILGLLAIAVLIFLACG
jgi:hypothetical protein